VVSDDLQIRFQNSLEERLRGSGTRARTLEAQGGAPPLILTTRSTESHFRADDGRELARETRVQAIFDRLCGNERAAHRQRIEVRLPRALLVFERVRQRSNPPPLEAKFAPPGALPFTV